MALTESIDGLIHEYKRQLDRLSTECQQEIERESARIREKYALEIATFSDSLAHLEAVKANHSGQAPRLPSRTQQQMKPRKVVQARNESGDSKFPVLKEVRGIVRGLKGEYSLDEVAKFFDERHPGIRKTLNRTSIHRAVNILVRDGEAQRVGLGKYRNIEQ